MVGELITGTFYLSVDHSEAGVDRSHRGFSFNELFPYLPCRK